MQNSPRSSAMQLRRLVRRVATVLGATLVCLALASGAFAVPPDLILSDSNMRANYSMSAAQIQAFLNTQTGVLKTYSAPDINGVTKPASLIIYEACQAWGISPRVMLTMLQKEQSLLTRTTLGTNTLARAIGAGCPDAITNKYPGFGAQMWHGARLLDGYGEVSDNKTTLYVPLWTPGLQNSYTGTGVHTASLATYKLYVYNPSISGNTNFYNIYLRYFGDPTAGFSFTPITGPAGSVFRFYNAKLGSHFYTASVDEANSVQNRLYATFRYEGPAYIANQSKNSTPLYRFYNKKNGGHFYTASVTERDYVYSKLSSTYQYDGPAYNVSVAGTGGAAPVYRFYNKKNGTHFYTASLAERDSTVTKLGYIYAYEGEAFSVIP